MIRGPVSDKIPCPYCGSEHIVGDGVCQVCGSRLDQPAASNVGTGRCARCGSEMPEQFDFCPVCGLDQRHRFRRPATRGFRLHSGPSAAASVASGPVAQAQPLAHGHGNPAMAAGMPGAPIHSPATSAHGGGPGQPVAQAAAPTGPPAQVVLVQRDGSEGQSFAVSDGHAVIGRTEGDIQFAHDRFLSPRHAQIDRDGDDFRLIDLGSRNGVYLRIHGTETVYPGDLFLIGHQLLRLENLSDGEQERAADTEGTRLFGSPVDRAWGKVQLIGGGGASGDTFYLRGSQVVFGREAGEVIFPQDAFLSRQHARLSMGMTQEGMSVLLEDLDSANGSYLRVRGQVPITAGSMFRVGDQILKLRTS